MVWIIDMLFRLAVLAILARVVIKWVGVPTSHGFGKLLDDITQPILQPFRSRMNIRGLRADFSPLLAILVLIIFQWIIVRILNG